MSFDFSAVDAFWPAVDRLSEDQEPDADTWSHLFSRPAYRALTASEFSVAFFQRCWRLSYMPSRSSETPPGRLLHFIRHYRTVRDKRGELQDFLAGLARRPDVYERAVELARMHLPPDDSGEDPSAAFAVFDLDGRGYRPIVVDPLKARTAGNGLVPFLAHEFHHHYVSGRRGLPLGATHDDRTDLEWVADQIHLEGLANMVNVDPGFERGTCPPSFVEEVQRTPTFLHFFSQQLQRLGRRPQEAESIGRCIRTRLPESGHPVGYYVARTIRDRLGREKLLRTTDDPLLFFREFSRAERTAGRSPTLPRAALDALEQHLC